MLYSCCACICIYVLVQLNREPGCSYRGDNGGHRGVFCGMLAVRQPNLGSETQRVVGWCRPRWGELKLVEVG